ncbi:hypothetical protein QA639_40300 [Bradyrhizobium pachyrhizi]|uniref:hypothetical protein n=1 Tax=Bradyrhizobium pachyrhizi TaxID=280333 RepID=UPI0024B065C8|nr:hypothetical protein [Bradyrhizobium pachyrhizi]WFU55713.1 hypothetical protein QA639_40300 [Bradyrhizobium pachyrhizi]
MTNAPLKPVESSLPLHSSSAMWVDALKDVDDDYDNMPIPPHLNMPEGFTSSEDSDAIARAQVTPEMRAASTSYQREMLANLDAEVRKHADPLNSVHLMARMATMISYGTVPPALAFSTFAQAAMERGSRPFYELYHDAHEQLIYFRDQSRYEGKPATPAFNSDEYGPMAAYIHNQGLEGLTALNEREFFHNDERVSTHSLNAIIDARLRVCSLWDPIGEKSVPVSNRLVNEVRGAMARMWPRLSDQGTAAVGVTGPRYAQRVALFGENQTCLDTDAWTSSAILWQAWIAFCESRSERPGANSSFFKELARWSGGRIQRGKKGKGSSRAPGYCGIKLI